jgi:hypothetical protein
MADALDADAGLGSLLARVQASAQRLASVRTSLPPGLVAHLRPGPLDDSGWTLLAANGAAASKLRQCLPALRQCLLEQGWPDVPIRVKVHVARSS